MNRLIFLAIVFIIGLLQATILDVFKFFWVKPDLLLASVVIASLLFELKWALIAACFAGLLKDMTGIHTPAIYILLFPLWSFLIIRLSRQITLENDFIPPVIVFVMVVSDSIVTRMVSLSLGGQVASLGIFLRATLIESVYTALVFILLFKITKHILYYKK